jgi:NDMA-dependent alcohol dehydrogenase
VKAQAAILREVSGAWEVVDVDLEEPLQNEVVVKVIASGLCHTDDHLVTGDILLPAYPVAGGHEGAGVIERVGPHTEGFEIGDHVILSTLSPCGRCRWCASGMQSLCDLGRDALTGSRSVQGTSRLSLDGKPVSQFMGVSTFSNYTVVSTMSVVKIPKDLPLGVVCLLGCGVTTGWGSAVKAANVRVGETVIIMGVGGVGTAAVQGAAKAGAMHVIAVDPVEFKRESALKFGATHAFAAMEEATEFARSVTNGQGADSAIITVSVASGEHIAEAVESIRKAGVVVLTSTTGAHSFGIPIKPSEFTMYQKRLQGTLMGHSNPTWDILAMVDNYRAGQLLLDEMITQHYCLAEVNTGYADMKAGKIIRGVLDHQH